MKLLLIGVFLSTYVLAGNSCLDDAINIFVDHSNPKARVAKLVKKFKNSGKEIIFDIGGEGRYVNAININPALHLGTHSRPGDFIPNRVLGFSDSLPIENNIADILYLENAPLTLQGIKELKRVAKKNFKFIKLVHPSDYSSELLPQLKEVFPYHNIEQAHFDEVTHIIISP